MSTKRLNIGFLTKKRVAIGLQDYTDGGQSVCLGVFSINGFKLAQLGLVLVFHNINMVSTTHAELIPMNFGIGPSTDFVDQSRLPHMSDRIIITNVNII